MSAPSIGRSSMLLASGTVFSRILGFVRAIVLAQALGVVASAGADAFAVANQLPNNLYVIVAGGVLTATLVPAIVKSALHRDGGAAYINKLVTIALVILVGTTLAAVLLAPVLVNIYALGWNDQQLALATAFAYWCLPQIFFYGLYALLGEILNGRGSFGPFTWAPALNNIVAIAGLIVFIVLFGADSAGVRSVTDWTPGMIATLAGTATLGVAAQALVLTLFWRRIGLTWRPDFRWRGVGLRETGQIAGWTFGMILLTQVAGLVETNVTALASGTAASVFALQNAWLIFMLPHSVIAVSIATAYFTRMSAHAAAGDTAKVVHDANESLRRIGLFMFLGAAGLIAVAMPFARLFTENNSGVAALGELIMVLAVGLPAFSALFVMQRVFFALGDGRTPFLITLFQAVLFSLVVLACTLLPKELITLGVAAALSVVGILQTLLAAFLLRRKLAARRLGILPAYLVGAIAGIVSAAAGSGVAALLGGFTAGGFATANFFTAIVSMIIIGIVTAGVFALLLGLFKRPELGDLWRWVRRARATDSAE